jgi:hypothetical protein
MSPELEALADVLESQADDDGIVAMTFGELNDRLDTRLAAE